MMPDAFFALVLRRIAWRYAVPWLIRGLAAGAVVAALVLLIARVIPLENRAWWALGAGVALAVAGGGVGRGRRGAARGDGGGGGVAEEAAPRHGAAPRGPPAGPARSPDHGVGI